MDINEIDQFLTALGCSTSQHDDWIRAACPLAPFLHKNGRDSKPSFGMTPEIGGARYHCFSCTSGSASSLLYTLQDYAEKFPSYAHRYDFEVAQTILDNGALNVTRLKDYEDRSLTKEFYEWSDWFMDNMPPAMTVPRAKNYLTNPKPELGEQRQPHHGRGLTQKEIIDWNFRYDPMRDMVVIPFYDQYGRFAGMRGRSIEGKRFHDYTFHDYNNTDLTWCNEPCFVNDEPVVVVEGQFDMITVAREYENTVANLTARISERKLRKLLDCPGVIFMLDNDETGVIARNKAIEFLVKNNVRVGFVEYVGHDPDSLTGEQIREALSPFIHPSKFVKKI